jgi:hypothetical protein
MISVKTNAHVGPDGTLAVRVPTPLRETDVEVVLVVQSLPAANGAAPATSTPEEPGWPVGFFERTFGALRDDPLERLPQGEPDEREAIE